MDLNFDALIEMYEKKRRLEEELSELNKRIEAEKSKLLIKLLETGIDHVSIKGYTIYVKNKESFKALNKLEIINFLKNNAPEFLSVHHNTLHEIYYLFPEIQHLIEKKETPLLMIRKS